MDLTLVLACYQEEEILEASVPQIVATLEFSRLSYEIVFVDDASRDRTRALIAKLIAAHPGVRMRAVYHERNQGRGRTVADGFRVATGDVVGFVDVDLEVHARYIPACVLAIRQGADVAVGARTYKVTLRGLWRHVLSSGYARIVRWLLPCRGLTDTESGYKFFRREHAVALAEETRDPGWFWDTEIMVRARLKGLTIAEIPCLYVRNFRKTSTVRGLRDSLVYLRRLLAFRFRELPGLARQTGR